MNSQLTFMVGRTADDHAVWKTDGGRPFIMPDGENMTYIGRWPFPWPKKWGYTRLPEPHLTYAQVAIATKKAEKVLRALRSGPVFEKGGLYFTRDNRLLMSKKAGRIVMHWMDGCGFAMTREDVGDGRTKVDLDVDACIENGVFDRKEGL